MLVDVLVSDYKLGGVSGDTVQSFFLSCGHVNQEAFDVNNTRIWREVSLCESTICPSVGGRGLLCLLWEKLVEP